MSHADGPERVVEINFTPVRRAQVALWIESADGTRFRTIALTEGVALRGIGNRPGAAQMNSGFRWPYGRREGVLPVWGSRRIASGGAPFQRVIFQDRTYEGHASRSSDDSTADRYFCLSFNRATTTQEALDAVACASVFNSDKGRYIKQGDRVVGDPSIPYAEPSQTGTGTTLMAPLSLTSLYPPRRDLGTPCARCADHEDAAKFAADARRIIPELDAVTTATFAETPRMLQFTLPADWPEGEYAIFLEINTEGDHNETYSQARYPTPRGPQSAWDYWAMEYGYAYRGQPSVVYRVPFSTMSAGDHTSARPEFIGSFSGRVEDGPMALTMNDTITDDPARRPGSGADRLRMQSDGARIHVITRDASVCANNAPPPAAVDFVVEPHPNTKHSHEWGFLSFRVPQDDLGISRYEIRFGTDPIVDEESFLRAKPANAATLEPVELTIPSGVAPGQTIRVEFGGMFPQTHYHVGIRPIDTCNVRGPIQTAEITTTMINFTTVSPCFVASAAFGTPLAKEIGPLRRFRDRHLLTNAIGRAAVRWYYREGPSLAERMHGSAVAKTVVRSLVRAAVWILTVSAGSGPQATLE